MPSYVELRSPVTVLDVPQWLDSVRLNTVGPGKIGLLCDAYYLDHKLLFPFSAAGSSNIFEVPYPLERSGGSRRTIQVQKDTIVLNRGSVIRLAPLVNPPLDRVTLVQLSGEESTTLTFHGDFNELSFPTANSFGGDASNSSPVRLAADSISYVSVRGMMVLYDGQAQCDGAPNVVLEFGRSAEFTDVNLFFTRHSVPIRVTGTGDLSKILAWAMVERVSNAGFGRVRQGRITLGAQERTITGPASLSFQSHESSGRMFFSSDSGTEYRDPSALVLLSGEYITPRRWESIPSEVLALLVATVLGAMGYLLMRWLRIS
jgi:hypothetical protein